MKIKRTSINGNKIYRCNDDVPIWVIITLCIIILTRWCYLTKLVVEELIKCLDICMLVMMISIWVLLILLIWNVIIDTFKILYFDMTGLHVKYPLQKWEVYPWTEFQEISVIYRDPVRERNTKNTACICFVLKGVKRGALTGKWIAGDPRYIKKIFEISYDEEALISLRAVCPCDVPDLRNTLKYKLF